MEEKKIVTSTNSEEPPEKKARTDCVPIEEEPNKINKQEDASKFIKDLNDKLNADETYSIRYEYIM